MMRSMRIRPTVVTVDLAALTRNVEVVRRHAAGQAMCAVVKADAYGHGLVPVGKTLERAGLDWLAVALVEEGMALRQSGVRIPILVMGAALEGGWEALVEHQLVPVLFRPDQLDAYARVAPRGAPVHLKIDTGMARLGVAPAGLGAFLEALGRHKQLVLDGLLTHLANADLLDHAQNSRQLEELSRVHAQLLAQGHKPRWLHAANSAGTLTHAEARLGLMRPGLLLYGLSPVDHPAAAELEPVMRWSTKAVHLKTVPEGTRVSYGGRWQAARQSVLATLPVGYADGYPRAMTGKAQVLVRGQRAPVVGTISMDLCVADVTDVTAAGGMTLDDEVMLLGRQGKEQLTAHDLARWAGTIAWEIICGVGPRVPRVYVP